MARENKNTFYQVQIEQIALDNLQQLNVEEGAVIEVEGIIYIGINGEWKQLYLNVGEQLGWGRFDDDQYTSGSPYLFTTNTEFIVPNNASTILDINNGSSYYNKTTQRISADNKFDTYLITIAFKAYMDSNNEHLELYLDGGGSTPYTRVKDIILFPKGNGIEHQYAKTFQYYADIDVITNGLQVKMLPSTTGAIYDVIYFIQKVQNHG